jgi:hypothetical protein
LRAARTTKGGAAYAAQVRGRLLLLGVLALNVGCAGSGSDPQAAPSATPTIGIPARTAPTCPSPAAGGLRWPEPVPDDLPVPPGATPTEVEERSDGLTVVTFSTPTSIREAVLFLIEQMPAAGYTLARGDAENVEADVPFVKGDLRGVMRMIAVAECRTDWLMALATAAPTDGAPGGPLLPPRPNASPLPFG